MIRSDWRREAMPAWDRIFWRRSSGMSGLLLRFRLGSGDGFGNGFVRNGRNLFCCCGFRLRNGFVWYFFGEGEAADLLELLERRELGQILEPELDQELLRR